MSKCEFVKECDKVDSESYVCNDGGMYGDRMASCYNEMSMRNILIIRNDHIGDLFFSTQAFREIKKEFPKSRITLVVSPGAKQLIEFCPYIDEIIELEIANHSLKSIMEYFKCGLKIRKKKFDVGIDMRGSPMNAALLLRLGGIRMRIGKEDASQNKFKQWLMRRFLNVPVFTDHHKSTTHLAKENIFIVNKGLSTNIIDWVPEIHTKKEDQLAVDKYLDDNTLGDFICIMPCANGEYKQWPMERWSEIINFCISSGFEVILLGSKKEEDKLNELASKYMSCKVLTDMNLRSISLLFKDSSLTLGSDSGVLHIAGASGKPVIVLSPSKPAIFKNGKFMPLGESKVMWANGADMSSITVEQVKDAIKGWIV